MCKLLIFNPKGDATTVSLTLLGTEFADLAEQSQRGLVLALSEKVIRHNDATAIASCAELLNKFLAGSQSKLDTCDCEHGRLKVLENGWFPQPMVDIHALRLCGSVVAQAPSGAAERTMREEAIVFIRNFDKLSSRVKALFRNINGAMTQHGKTAYDFLKRLADEGAEMKDMRDNTTAKMQGLTRCLDEALVVGEVPEAYNAMVEVLQDNFHIARKFGKSYGDVLDSGADELDCAAHETARNFYTSFCGCLGIVTGDWCKSSELSRKIFGAEFETWRATIPECKGEDAAEDPVEMQIMNLCAQAFDLMYAYCPLSAVDLFFVARERARLTMFVYDSWRDYGFEGSIPKIRKAWQRAWAAWSALPEAPSEIAHAELLAVHTFIREIEKIQDMPGMLRGFALEVYSGRDSAAVASEFSGAPLPEEFGEISACAIACHKIEQAAQGIKDGREAMGLLELSILLAQVERTKAPAVCKDLILRRAGFSEACEAAQTEFHRLLADYLQKCDIGKFMADFKKQYAALDAAVASWSFEACPWLTKDQTSDEEAMGKRAEQIIVQYSVWLNVLERTGQHLQWTDDETRRRVEVAAATMTSLKKQVDELGVLFGTMIITSVILRGEIAGVDSTADGSLSSATKFVEKKLKVDFEALPKKLRARMELRKASAPTVTGPAPIGGDEQPASRRSLRKRSAIAETT